MQPALGGIILLNTSYCRDVTSNIANGCSYPVQGVYCRFKGLWYLLGTEKKGVPKGTFILTLGNQRKGLHMSDGQYNNNTI